MEEFICLPCDLVRWSRTGVIRRCAGESLNWEWLRTCFAVCCRCFPLALRPSPHEYIHRGMCGKRAGKSPGSVGAGFGLGDDPIGRSCRGVLLRALVARLRKRLRLRLGIGWCFFLRLARGTYLLASSLFRTAGLRHTKTHTLCRRCGKRSFHKQKTTCSSCGYPASKIRKYNWSVKAIRRKTTGTGRMRYLKVVQRKAKNGFQTTA